MLATAAAAFTGVLTGRKKAEARALSTRVSYQIADVCLGKPATEPTVGSEPLRFAWANGSRYQLSQANDDELLDGLPRAVGCIVWSRDEQPVATVTLRDARTAEIITTRTFPSEIDGVRTTIEVMSKALSASVP